MPGLAKVVATDLSEQRFWKNDKRNKTGVCNDKCESKK